jgi:2'-5' RNA ligase
MSSWFIALPVRAGDWFSRLSPTPSGTRLLAAEDLHLTVAFLGAVGEASARAAFDSLPPAAIRRFKISLGAVVPMGNPRRPSALSVQIEGTDGEGRSIADVLFAPRDALREAADLPTEKRPMRPHVTLARLRRKASAKERQRAFAWAEESDLASTRIGLDRIGLYTAARDRRAHAYDIIESRRLRV